MQCQLLLTTTSFSQQHALFLSSFSMDDFFIYTKKKDQMQWEVGWDKLTNIYLDKILDFDLSVILTKETGNGSMRSQNE